MSLNGWSVDYSAPIGSGGFGKVYEGLSPIGAPVAAKVVRKAPGSDRELLAVDLSPSPHLVPVLHIQETADELVLFMPRAEKSLRDRLSDGAMDASESLEILRQIATALVAIEGKLVHRDLKPENVLLLEGNWAICDFGIARYAEASTAPDTQKFAMTPPYAAPEQWRHEHAVGATDVYAFGVIAHEVLSGQRPFGGPRVEDFRKQHLNETPPRVATTKKLASLVDECLFKAPGARPSAQNLLARIESAGSDARLPGASALADAHQAVVAASAAEQRAREEARTEQERRDVLAQAASQLFAQISAELVETIEEAAPTADIRHVADGSVQIELGSARLTLSPVSNSRRFDSEFDIICHASITLRDSRRGHSRSHSLYYANFYDESSYAWYELAFSGTFQPDFQNEPRAAPPAEGLQALSRTLGTIQLGRPIRPLILGELDGFIDEWSQRIGLTAQGRFPGVSQLPEGSPTYPSRGRH